MSMAAAVTTLGELELRGKPNHHHGDESSFRYPHSAFDENGGSCSNESYDEENTENTGLARMGGKNGGMARINLDLSGRVFCHLISRHKQSNGGVATGGRTTSSTVPLLSLTEPAAAAATTITKPMENRKQQQQYNINASSSFAKSIATRYINDVATYVTRRLELLLPHDIYIGTNYNFDEIWYGATRFITQCSWGPYYDIQRRRSGSGGQLVIPWSSSSSSLANKSFWTINVEKEMNTFDRYDTTSRIRCVQQYPSPSPSSPSSSSVTSPHTTAAASSRHISLEYDSAKLNTNIDNIDNGNDSTITMTADHIRSRSNNKKRSDNGQYLAPTMSMHVNTPLFHPRLVAHVKKTWIINDDSTNSDSVNRRYSGILERYRNSIPKSIIVHPSTISGAGAAVAAVGGHGYKEKLSTWFENDGWKPQKMTVNLLGNVITRHEIGLISSPPTPTTTPTLPLTKQNCRQSSTTPSWHIIHDTGIRLSLSKKIDWATMGMIFPWSTNNSVGGSGSRRHNNVGGSNSGGSSSMLGILQSTHARLELCGMYGASSLPQQNNGMATGRMSIGVDVEPLDWSSTFRVTVCHEDVSFL